MAITPLPTAPSRYDPANFTVRAEAFFAALATMVSELNSQAASNVVGNLGVTGIVQTTGIDASGTTLAIGGTVVPTGQTKTVGICNNPNNAGTVNINLGNTNLGATTTTTVDGHFKVTGYGATRLIETSYASEGVKIRSAQTGGFWAKVLFADATTNLAMVGMADTGSGNFTLQTLTAKPIVFGVNNTAYAQMDTSGNLVMTGLGALGYAAGSGGAVAQLTDKTTGVTLNKVSGVITTNAASLAAGASVSFTLTNSLISATDHLAVSVQWTGVTPENYRVRSSCGAGAARITLENLTAGALAQAVPINFQLFKGANA